jgi:hypothetical protein
MQPDYRDNAHEKELSTPRTKEGFLPRTYNGNQVLIIVSTLVVALSLIFAGLFASFVAPKSAEKPLPGYSAPGDANVTKP